MEVKLVVLCVEKKGLKQPKQPVLQDSNEERTLASICENLIFGVSSTSRRIHFSDCGHPAEETN